MIPPAMTGGGQPRRFEHEPRREPCTGPSTGEQLAAPDVPGRIAAQQAQARAASRPAGPRRRLAWRRHVTLAVLLAAVTVLLSLSPSPAGAAGVALYGRPVCGGNWVPVDVAGPDGKLHGNYFNVYNEPDGHSCIVVGDGSRGSVSYRVSHRNSYNRWQDPFISTGLVWGKNPCYDARSGLSRDSQCQLPDPVQVKHDGHPLTSVVYWPHGTAGNVSFDIWFNRERLARSRYASFGQADGTELMIWLSHPGVYVSPHRYAYYVDLQGRRFGVIDGHSYGHGVHWHYVAYVALRQTRVFRHVWLNYFVRDSIRHRVLSPDWWLTSVNFGAEMLPYWRGSVEDGTGFYVSAYHLSGLPTVAQTRYPWRPGGKPRYGPGA